MFQRPEYIKKVIPFIGKPVIKVITGIRRSGKSSVLELIQNYMFENESVEKRTILYINKESLRFAHIKNEIDLYNEATNLFNKVGKIRLFVDEVQEIDAWEKAIASLLSDGIADIYITGSNAHLLSSELATLLAGRYVSISIYPLSFLEFMNFRKSDDKAKCFQEFLSYGGLPGIHHLDFEERSLFQYIGSVFDSIVLKDIIQRNSVRNSALLEKIMLFILDNIGSVFSANSIANYFKSESRKVSLETIYNYLSFLQTAFVVHKVQRYDIYGKKILEIQEKYFVGDIGLRNGILGYKDRDISGLLENIIYLELCKRGYTLFIGKVENREVDFIATRGKAKIYIQVSYLLASESTIEREFSVLESIPDNYPKIVLSMDNVFPEERNGILWRNIISFLLNDEF